jgi:hypothetical protein
MQNEELDTSPVEIDDALMIDDDDISDDDDDDDDDHEVTVCKLNAPPPHPLFLFCFVAITGSCLSLYLLTL